MMVPRLSCLLLSVRVGALSAALLWLTSVGHLSGAATDEAFDAANRFYETEQFDQAIDAYQNLLNSGVVSPALLFNLGNAYYKAGHPGEAIVAWRRAEQLKPRDPELKENLKVVREEILGDTPPGRSMHEWLHLLTLNEWSVLLVVTSWLWFGLLSAGEWNAGFRNKTRLWRRTAGALFGATALLALLTISERMTSLYAVVITEEAVVRYGPLQESQSAFTVGDGYEFRVKDMKDNWLAVVDADGRRGWIYQDQVQLLGGANP